MEIGRIKGMEGGEKEEEGCLQEESERREREREDLREIKKIKRLVE